MAQVHRYGDKVAVNLGQATHYLTQAEARYLAEAAARCADDIGARPFTKSEFRTVNFTVQGGRD